MIVVKRCSLTGDWARTLAGLPAFAFFGDPTRCIYAKFYVYTNVYLAVET